MQTNGEIWYEVQPSLTLFLMGDDIQDLGYSR